MTELLDELVRARRPWISGRLGEWYPDPALLAQLRDALAVEASRLDDVAFGAQFRDALGVRPESEALSWANRRLDLPDGGWAVAGIRFRGRDGRRPFVDVVATTAPPTPDGLASVAETVAAAYADFEPLCLRVDALDPDEIVAALRADSRFGPGCAVDMYVVAGLVRSLRQHPRAAAYDDVTLRRSESGDDTAALSVRVAEIYRALTELQPELAMWATAEGAESLGECAEEGLLFEILGEGRPAGVVAGLRHDDHAMRGFSVQEICLDPAHRGRRLAPGVIQRVVDELPAGDGDVLWGTIHPANRPSLRNALSVGREVVGGYVWVTPAGMPGMPTTTRATPR